MERNVQSLIAEFRKQLQSEKKRFDTSTCTSRRNSHVEAGQLLSCPAIRRTVLVLGGTERTKSYCWVQETATIRKKRDLTLAHVPLEETHM